MRHVGVLLDYKRDASEEYLTRLSGEILHDIQTLYKRRF